MSQIKRGIAEYFIPMQLSNVFSLTQSHCQLETFFFYPNQIINNLEKPRLIPQTLC